MSRQPGKPAARRLVFSVAVIFTQLAVASWIPIVHAQSFEDARVSAIENGHSSDCPEVHDDRWCVVCVASHGVVVSVLRDAHPGIDDGSRHKPRDMARNTKHLDFLLAHGIRAPPLS